MIYFALLVNTGDVCLIHAVQKGAEAVVVISDECSIYASFGPCQDEIDQGTDHPFPKCEAECYEWHPDAVEAFCAYSKAPETGGLLKCYCCIERKKEKKLQDPEAETEEEEEEEPQH